jgi:hypothetical protein
MGKDSDIEESNQSDGRIHKSELSAFRPHKLPDEPKDSETRLLLAVKLPDRTVVWEVTSTKEVMFTG